MTTIPRLAAAFAAALALAAPAPATAQGGALDARASFFPSTIGSGEPSSLRVRLENTNDGTIGGIAFDVVFPAPMGRVGVLDEEQCGGTVSPFNRGVQVRRVTLGPFAVCTIQVGATAESDATRVITVPIGPITSNSGDSLNVSAALTVVGGIPPTITSPQMSTPAFVGLPYTHQVTVTGTPPIVVTAEGLPPGLTYSDVTRRVTGTPTTTGAFLVTLRATNGIAPAAAQVSPVQIIHPPLQILNPDPLAPPLSILEPVSIQLQAAGGLPPYRWDLPPGSTLPPGLSLTGDGRIVGAPTAPGTYPFSVRVIDSLTQFTSREYELVVRLIGTTLKLTLSPNPAVSSQVVVASAVVEPQVGPPPPGTLSVWIAGPGTRCPDPFESGPDPVTPNAKTATVTAGVAQIPFPGLAIGRFRACARYEGPPPYAPSSIGPLDLFVIKGILLPSPSLTVDAPKQAVANRKVSGRVRIEVAGTTFVPSGTIRVRAGARDLGELPIVGGVAAFETIAPDAEVTIAVTASYAGDGGFAPAVADPAYVAVTKSHASEAIPVLGDTALALVSLMLAGLAAARLRRRK